jgi:hypothetical protein
MTFAIAELNSQLIQLLLQVFLIADHFFLFHGNGWLILHLALLFHPLEQPG